MDSVKRVKVAKFSSALLRGDDFGRYVLIVPLTPYFTFIGAEAIFYDSQGAEVSGRIVSMTEEIKEGKFPLVANNERVLDTRFPKKEEKHKRMAQGGTRSFSNSAPLTAKGR